MIALRPYQLAAVDAAFEQWQENTSTLIVCPTGTGKTTIFSEIARRFQPLRTIAIAHREELIFQIQERFEQFGMKSDIEMGDYTAVTNLFGQAPCVVATVQTLVKRLERFDPLSFGLLIVDEFHHATAATYRKVLDHFKANSDLRICGATATPDRADEEALGQIMDTVAYDYEILDAINDGWLVPIEQQRVCISGLDFSNVRTTAGDLNGGDLEAVMEQEKNVQGIVGSSIDLIKDQQAILFASSVVHAEKCCEIFNRHKSGMAAFICGMTQRDERRQIVAKFRDGTIQVLCNVGCATEGFDAPNTAAILVGRPTKSRCLYAQMAGRGLRPLPGLVDPFVDAESRKAAIAKSNKPTCLLVDFVGNSGRHKLISGLDILGGKVSDETLARAQGLVEKAKGSAQLVEVLEEAEEQLRAEREKRRQEDAARRARLVAKVQFSSRKVDPFDVLDIAPAKERGWDKGKVASEKQIAMIRKSGIDPTDLPYSQVQQLCSQLIARWRQKKSTFKQCSLLKRFSVDATDMSMGEASALIDKIAKNNWHFTPDMLPVKREPPPF